MSAVAQSNEEKASKRTQLALTVVIASLAFCGFASAALRLVAPSATVAVLPAATATGAMPAQTLTPLLTDEEQAFATQQALIYPGPVPSNVPAQGEPTPDSFDRLRAALRWTPYSANVLYLTRKESELIVAFGVTEAVYPGVSAANTLVSARVILGILSQSSLNYNTVVLRGIRDDLGTGSGPTLVRLVYMRETVLSHDWLKQPIGDGEDIYAYANSKQIDPSLVPAPYHPMPERSPDFEGETTPTP